jgi:hypothetical protein
MKLRLPLIGSGVVGDEWRCNLPTYRMLDVDYVGKVAVVEIPEADHPFIPAQVAALVTAASTAGPAISAIPPALRVAWHNHLDARYTEHSGAYRPVPQ